MSPRNRKKGLTRMDAALDAMRPMGFKAGRVRKCVRDLLKVYGNDGWSFIEDAAYKVLIETILELSDEPPRFEHVPAPLLEGNVDDSPEVPVSESEEPCKEVVIGAEDACPVNSPSFQMLLEKIDAVEEEVQGQKVAPKLLKESYAAQSQVGVCVGFAPNCTPQARDIASKNKKPSYGWISDDDEDEGDSCQLNSAKLTI